MTEWTHAVALAIVGFGAGALAAAAPAAAIADTAWPGGDAITQSRQRLLADGEARLVAGDTAAAERAFDAAALMRHAADAELGLVRTHLQAGDYRRAVSFAAHVAAAHREEPAAAAQYAWLLHLGGQTTAAKAQLDAALAAAPADPSLLRVRALTSPAGAAADDAAAAAAAAPAVDASVDAAAPVDAVPVLAPLLGPYEHSPSTVDPAARVAGSGVLDRTGRFAWVPARSVEGARGIWLRNGLGEAVAARVDRIDASSGVALLRLQSPLRVSSDGWQASPREPFAGSPGLLIEYAHGGSSPKPAWPQLRQGFLGRPPPAAGTARPFGIEAPAGPHGGPVFDAAGRLVGMAAPAADGSASLLPVAGLLGLLPGDDAAVGEAAPAASPSVTTPPASTPVRSGEAMPVAAASVDAPASARPIGADAVYERALRLALALLVVR